MAALGVLLAACGSSGGAGADAGGDLVGGGGGGSAAGGSGGGPGGVGGAGGSGAADAAAGGAPGTGGSGVADAAEGGDAAAAEAGACQIERATPPLEGAAHVALCAPVTHATRPPASGTHYPQWPVFRIYDQPVPWGFLLHGMEHGAVVLVYNCPQGCSADVEAAKALINSLPAKPACPRPPVIMAPDPTLDVPFAAAAWGHTLRASCFDRAAFQTFITERANKGPEYWDEDCGYTDREAMGWCP